MDRYAGKPFLRLLECYVLSAIGQLDAAQQATLQRMEPKLSSVYNISGSWLDIVRSQMDFPDTLPEKIRAIWERNLTTAQAQGFVADPNAFAMQFVDQNFV